jgi:hypothetical protein
LTKIKNQTHLDGTGMLSFFKLCNLARTIKNNTNELLKEAKIKTH